MHVTVCNKCGDDCEVPFRPTSGKPVYCDKCFEKSDHRGEKSTELLKIELELINKKLDKLVAALIPVVSKKDVKEAQEEAEDQKPEKKTTKTFTTKAKKSVSAKKTTASKTAVKKPVAAKKTTATKTKAKKT